MPWTSRMAACTREAELVLDEVGRAELVDDRVVTGGKPFVEHASQHL
jgi:hypothetical protein